MPSFIMVEECFRQADYSIKTEGEPSQGWKNYRTSSVCHSDRWNVNRLPIEKSREGVFFRSRDIAITSLNVAVFGRQNQRDRIQIEQPSYTHLSRVDVRSLV